MLVVTSSNERRLRGMRGRTAAFAKQQDRLNPHLYGWFFTNRVRLRESTNPLDNYVWDQAEDDGEDGYFRMLALDECLAAAEAEWRKLETKISEAKSEREREWLREEGAAAYQVYMRTKPSR